MEFLHVKTGEEMMIFIAIIIARFGTHVHSYIDVQLLHPAPVPFALWKGLSGVKRKENLDCLFPYFLPKEEAFRLLALLVLSVHVKAVTLVAIKI